MKQLINSLTCLIIGHKLEFDHIEPNRWLGYNSIYRCERCDEVFKNYYK